MTKLRLWRYSSIIALTDSSNPTDSTADDQVTDYVYLFAARPRPYLGIVRPSLEHQRYHGDEQVNRSTHARTVRWMLGFLSRRWLSETDRRVSIVLLRSPLRRFSSEKDAPIRFTERIRVDTGRNDVTATPTPQKKS